MIDDAPMVHGPDAGRLLNRCGPLWPILRRYTWTVPVVATLSFVSSLLEGLGIGLMIPLMTALLSDPSGQSESGPMQQLFVFAQIFPEGSRLVAISGAILALVAAKGLIQSITLSFVAWIDGNAGHVIRVAIGRRLLDIGFPFFLTQNPARLITITATESWRTIEAMRMILTLASGLAALCVFALLLALVSWRLFLVVFLGVLVIRGLQLLYSRHLEHLSARFTPANHILGERMMSLVDTMRLLRIFGREQAALDNFSAASNSVRRIQFALESRLAYSSPMLETLHATLFVGVLLLANSFGMDLPTLITFLILLYRMQPHVMNVNNARLGLASTRTSVAEVEWLLDPQDKPVAASGTIPFAGLDGPIRFEAVSFQYPNRPDAAPALDTVSFSIAQHSVFGLLGRSGSGKSTVVNLLCRLYEPTGGRITLAGADLAAIDTATLRARIGIAGQDIDLVTGSIAENIAYGKPDATAAEIEEAARMADAHDFIAALPDGYRSLTGNRGLSLSGGQRQRIGLARALIRKPDLLILDEATNAVDGLSESAITALLNDRNHFGTAIVISHRWSTLACCDNAVVLDQGRVSEVGPLADLAFAKLMSGYESDPKTQAGAKTGLSP